MNDKLNVLFIDDDLTILDITQQFLELTGEYIVTPVDNAADAIHLLSKKSFDAIVSDYEMEEMNGIELLKYLREKGDTTPFIVFTGKGREEVVIEALNSGADFYLQKGGQPSAQFAELSNIIRYAVSRRHAEKDLLESEKKTTDIIEFLPDATFAINTEGVVIAWNRAMEEMTGISKEEMIGKGDHTYMIPFYGSRRHSLLYLIDHDDEDLASKYEYVHRQGNTLYAEFYSPMIFNGSGAYLWVTGAPLFDNHGTRIGAIESIRDITDRKLTETELLKKNEELNAAYEEIAATEEELRIHLDEVTRQESILRKHENRLLMAQEIGQIGCWELDLATGIIWGSEEAFRIFAIPRPVDGYLSLEDVESSIPERKRVHQALIDLVSDGSEYNLEYLINPIDISASRVVHSVARLETDEHGAQRVMGIIQDVTLRKEAEERLRQTNAYLENLISIANVPIIIWDSSFRITRLNHAFEHLIGRSGLEVIGNPLEFLFPPDQAERSMRLFRITQDGVRWETVEIDILHRDGSLRTLLWNSATLYSADGITPVATIAQGHDITGERRLEQEKEAALVQIQQNLSYFAILNDEIRNPLTIILILADMIGDTKIVDEISCQTRRIDEMVNQLDKRWMDSEKVLNAIRKHYQIQGVQSEPQVNEEIKPASGRENAFLIEEIQAQLYTILDSIDALVYVADIKTHDLLFMNHRGRSLFGDITGQKCYQSMYGYTSGPCPFCTNYRLIDEFGPTGVYQWEFHNPHNGSWYDCRDRAILWSDGRFVRLEIATDITPRKKVEMALLDSEERYRKLIDNVPDYILVHRGGKILFVNAAAATSFGYTPEELIGSDMTRYLTPHSQSVVVEMMQKRVSGEKLPHYEITILTKDGSQKITEVHGVLILFEGGPASLNVLTDVTERKSALDKLRESEEKFRSIFDLMNDGIHIHEITPDGRPGKFIDVNDVACKMVQYSREEMLEHSPLDFVTGCHNRPLDEIIGELSTLGHVIFETEHQRKDGTIVPVEINSHLVNLQGKRRIISAVRDITKRKKIEQALRTSEAKYRQLVEYANDAIVVAQNGMLKFINPRMAELTGYSQEELLSQPFPTFIHPDDRTLVVDMHRKRIAGDNPSSRYLFRLVRKDETITWVAISAVTVEWEGNPATLNFLIDVTERKQAEEALRESNKKLRLLTSLTRHDIFNQLSAAELYANLAISSSDLAQVYEYVSHSKEANERIKAIVGFTREYEDFGIVSSGWQRIYYILESAKKEVTLRNVTVEILTPENIEVYADPIIRKVFTTLIENAVRHGGNLSIIRFFCSEREDTLIIICQDDGVGVPKGEKENIFDHGYGKHTGIGLFLSREILSITGLSIRECGAPGEGARFEILVPSGKFRSTQVNAR